MFLCYTIAKLFFINKKAEIMITPEKLSVSSFLALSEQFQNSQWTVLKLSVSGFKTNNGKKKLSTDISFFETAQPSQMQHT